MEATAPVIPNTKESFLSIKWHVSGETRQNLQHVTDFWILQFRRNCGRFRKHLASPEFTLETFWAPTRSPIVMLVIRCLKTFIYFRIDMTTWILAR
jgi:hypothetical protein